MPMMSITPARQTDRLLAASPVRPYGKSTFREEEPIRLSPGSAIFDSFDWGAPYRHAAETAAGWLRHSRQAQLMIRLSARKIKQNPSLSVIEEELRKVAGAVNGLLAFLEEAEPFLSPQLRFTIEQAMSHPAAVEYGLMLENGTWQIQLPDSGKNESSVQLLTGPQGWITCLHKALEEPLSARVLDLLRKDIPLLQPYSCYYNSMATYWPFPSSGMLLNRRL
ncbi:hypothetical protein [Paenibacillus sp. JDR-2]|uniref:hypothetical protein n=1 Tax=Paenibacillus sp. (strain JDR-2) TaxID=324057 RepID=UPI00016666C6|nr:hypothetical protein [Paenibacillus sp. JDR-2]ACS99787.1 hypothetical protein Pjdr2_1108 [Paenibacillus sp. JDR-2]